jgi:hypothetical protein
VLELGCGSSAIVGLFLGPKVHRYVLTDQPYVVKLVEQNLEENHAATGLPAKNGRARKGQTKGRAGAAASSSGITFKPLDWETDQVTPRFLAGSADAPSFGAPSFDAPSFDALLACDCIYNEALIEPLVQTCADACKLRRADAKPCVCIVAQQLRDPGVFEAWLGRFMQSFHVWRIPDRSLTEDLRSDSGFAIHVGFLHDAISPDELWPERHRVL